MREKLIIDSESKNLLGSGRPLAVWGASKLGECCYHELSSCGLSIDLFIDSNQSKAGSTFLGLPVVSSHPFFSENKSVSIIIASQYWNEIVRNLFSSTKIDEVAIFSMPAGSVTARIIHIQRDVNKSKRFDLCFFQSNYSGSNSYTLYKYAKEKHPNLRLVLLNRNELTSSSINDARSSGLHVVTHEHDFFDDTPSVQAYHGFPLKGIGAMSRYQSRGSMVKTREAWLRHHKIFSYSDLYTSLISACFGGFADQYEITGMPRNDYLQSNKSALTALKKLFPNLDRFQAVGFYAPTFRETKFNQVNGVPSTAFLPIGQIKSIEEFCTKNRIALVKKLHPYELSENKYESEVFLSCTDDDFQRLELDLYECLAGFDFLLTDFSSIFFDFLLLDKPMGFLAYDLDAYSASRGLLLENYDVWSPGPKINATVDFIDFLDSVINEVDSHKKERAMIRSMVHRFNDFTSSERCVQCLGQVLEEAL